MSDRTSLPRRLYLLVALSTILFLSGCSAAHNRTFDLLYHLSGRSPFGGSGAVDCGLASSPRSLARVNVCALGAAAKGYPFFVLYDFPRRSITQGLALSDAGQLFLVGTDLPSADATSRPTLSTRGPVKVVLCNSNTLIPDRSVPGLFLLTCEH